MDSTRRILTPCPPSKECPICEARLNEVFGSNPEQKPLKYRHQSAEVGWRGRQLVFNHRILTAEFEQGIQLIRLAGTYANLALNLEEKLSDAQRSAA